MKKFIALVLALALLVPLAPKGYSKEPVWQQSQSVSFSGGKRTVSAIFIDMNDETIRMEAVLAKNQVGQVDDLKNIAEQVKSPDRQVIGAINGTFFNAYTDLQPAGTVQTKGQFVHVGQTGSVIGFRADNSAVIENLYTYIDGSINGSHEYPNSWSAWGFNHKYDAANAIAVFTPAYGKTTGKHNRTSIVIDKGVVIKKCSGEAPIPPSGYTIVTGDASVAKRFVLGDKVNYSLKYFKSVGGVKGPAVNWDNMRTTIGAGPTLLKGGKILANGKSEGFSEDKINKNRAQRSFAGITRNNILIIGTVPNVNVKELAEIAKAIGVVNGINLDGGASSSLYFKGKYITTPGRKLSNALVITKLNSQPIRVQLNKKDMFFDFDPYLTNTNMVMVPLIQCFKYLDSVVISNNANGSITLQRYGKTYKFSNSSDSVSVNGREEKLPYPVETRNGQSYIPLQYIADSLGGSLTWDKAHKIAYISADTVWIDDVFLRANAALDSKNTAAAEEMYKKVLELDPEHLGALLKLASLYSGQNDYAQAIDYYTRYLDIKPNDLDNMYKLGWVYYRYGDMTRSAETFKLMTEKQPDNAVYWIALGSVYMTYSLKQYDAARICYKKALTLKPTKEQRQLIEKQLQYIDNMTG